MANGGCNPTKIYKLYISYIFNIRNKLVITPSHTAIKPAKACQRRSPMNKREISNVNYVTEGLGAVVFRYCWLIALISHFLARCSLASEAGWLTRRGSALRRRWLYCFLLGWSTAGGGERRPRGRRQQQQLSLGLWAGEGAWPRARLLGYLLIRSHKH